MRVVPPAPIPTSRVRWGVLLLAAVCVGLLYAACLTPDPRPGSFRYPAHRYHALQAEAWLQGRLDLPLPVPAAFAALPDPYDPKSSEPFRMAGENGIHDLSFRGGKLYLYWGPVPALTAFLPWRVLTGQALDSSWAGWAFAMGAWLAAAILVVRLVGRQWPGTSPIVLLLCLLALGICSWAPVVLRRSTVWEIPILAATCYGVLMFTLLAECIWSKPRWRLHWLAAASLALGLAVGSRPIWIVCSPCLLWPLWLWRAEWRQRGFWSLAAAAVVPVSLAVGGLLLLNQLRFGHFLEFGQQWQVAGVRMNGSRTFALGQVPYNLWQYLFSRPELTDYFPFVTDARRETPPAGYLGLENTFGLLIVLPWLWCAAFTAFRRDRAAVVPVVAWGGASMFGILCLFNGAAGRYQFEMAAPFALLAVCGALQLMAWSAPAAPWRLAGLALLLGASSLGTILVSVQFGASVTGHFDSSPRLEAAANRVATWLGWCPADAIGAVELTVDFSRTSLVRPSGAGAVVVSGAYPWNNSIGVGFTAADRLQFQAFRSFTVETAVELALDPAVPHRLRIELGALLPPENHPFWDDVPAFAARRRREQFRVLCDGVVILEGSMRAFPPAFAQPQVGFLLDHSGKPTNPFPGRILEAQVRRLATP